MSGERYVIGNGFHYSFGEPAPPPEETTVHRSNTRHRVALIAVLACGALGLTACGSSSGSGPKALSVVASTNVWAAVASAVTTGVAGVSVSSLITDPGADPHSYDATPSDAATVSDAQLVVYNGGGYDPFVSDVLESQHPDAATIEAVSVRDGLGEQADENEHVWYDVPTVVAVAGRVADQLGSLDPDHAAQFTTNAAAFREATATITARTDAIRSVRAGTEIVQTEPVAHYLLAAAGLVDATPEEFTSAIEEETDPPAAAVGEATDLVTSGRAKALVYNTQAESPVTQALRSGAEARGVPVVDVTETLPSRDVGYVGWLGGEAGALAAAVGAP